MAEFGGGREKSLNGRVCALHCGKHMILLWNDAGRESYAGGNMRIRSEDVYPGSR